MNSKIKYKQKCIILGIIKDKNNANSLIVSQQTRNKHKENCIQDLKKLKIWPTVFLERFDGKNM